MRNEFTNSILANQELFGLELPEDAIERLLGYVRRAPFRSLTEAFEIALGRDNIPESVKQRVVNTVGSLATGEARDFLVRVADAYRGRPAPWADLARASAARIQVSGGGM